MTNLFYSLDEAARELDISETVLVRLSQTLRVPETAYEETGYLSFKGDLSFSDHDISFFRQVKQRLLAGETLEDIKRRIHNPEPLQVPQPPQTKEAPPLNEVVQDTPDDVDALADKNFARYKHQNRPGTLKVFQNMLTELAKGQPKPKPQAPTAKPAEKRILPRIESFSPPQDIADEGINDLFPAQNTLPEDYTQHDPTPRIPKLPSLFGSGEKKKQKKAPKCPESVLYEDIPEETSEEVFKPAKTTQKPYASAPSAPELEYEPPTAFTQFTSPWEGLIRESARDSRDLSIHLKTAAQVLREKALKQGKTPVSSQKVLFQDN